jgi:hypothetical protein
VVVVPILPIRSIMMSSQRVAGPDNNLGISAYQSHLLIYRQERRRRLMEVTTSLVVALWGDDFVTVKSIYPNKWSSKREEFVWYLTHRTLALSFKKHRSSFVSIFLPFIIYQYTTLQGHVLETYSVSVMCFPCQ